MKETIKGLGLLAGLLLAVACTPETSTNEPHNNSPIAEDDQTDQDDQSSLPVAMSLSVGGRVLALKVNSDDIDHTDDLNNVELKQLTSTIYQTFDDEFDFIFFVSAFTSANVPNTMAYSGRYSSVRSFEQGIGINAFDVSANYGSAGTLQGLIHLAKVEAIRQGPSLHELMHRWANFSLPSIYYSHWAFASSGLSQGGQLGGFAYNSLGDLGAGQYQANNGYGDSFGLFANGGNGLPYSSYELYLMGLAGEGELNDYVYFDDGQWLDPAQGIFTSDNGPKTFTVTQTMNELGGTREPAYSVAQNEFRILTVLLYNGQLDRVLMNRLDSDLALFALPGSDNSSLYNFYEATKGRASIKVDGLEAAIK